MTTNIRNALHAAVICIAAMAIGGCTTVPPLRPGADRATSWQLDRPTTVRWGHPLAGKPPRVLIALPRLAARDADELRYRLDMQYEIVLIDDSAVDAGESTHPLRRALVRDYDLIVLADVEFASLTGDMAESIQAQVRAGTGLLLAHHRQTMPDWLDEFLRELAPVESSLPITRGVAATLTPEWREGLDFVHAGTFGDGRVVQLNYAGGSPAYHALLPELVHPERAEWSHYETYWSLIARAALWAARREPSQWIDRIQEETRDAGFAELPPGMTEAQMLEYVASTDTRVLHTYRLHLNSPARERYQVAVQLRQPGRAWRAQFTQPQEAFDVGSEDFLLSVPAIPGEFYFDAWIKHRNRTVDWHSVPVTVRARPHFRDLRALREVLHPNDTVAMTFDLLPSQQTEEGLRRGVVAIRATDAHGRRVAFHTEAASGAQRTQTVHFDVADLISNRVNAECFVLSQPPRAGEVKEFQLVNAGGARIQFGVRLARPVQRFHLALANHAHQEYALRALNESLADAGVTAVITPASEDAARFVPEAGLTPVFQLTQHWKPRDIEMLAAEGEIPDGAPLPNVLNALTGDVRRVRLGTAEGFVLGGADGFGDTYDTLYTSPSVTREFRDRLWAEFGTPAGLGSEWAQRFATWEAVSRQTIEEAAADGFFEPYIRYRQHVDAVFLRIYGLARDAVRSGEPLVRTGFSMVGAREGKNPLWHGSASAVELAVIPPERTTMARTRAYRDPEAMAILHVPGAPTHAEARWWPWHALLNGSSGLGWRLGEGPESAFGAYGGDIDPVFLEAITQTRAIQAGFADLFLSAQPGEEHVAIYDSRVSELLLGTRKNTGSALDDALGILSELGFAAKLISPSTVYPLALDGRKCLFLPGVAALSDVEAAHIETFVQRGGVAVADTQPGIFDAFGRPRDMLPFTGLFTPLEVKTPEASEAPDSDVPDVPEAGHSGYLLGHAFGEDRSPKALSRIESVLRGAGCRKAFEIEPAGTFAGQRFHFRFGMADLYAALAPPSQSRRARFRVALPATGYVYDMLTGLEVRRPKRIAWRADPGGVALFSALPYRVTEVRATVPERVRPGGRLGIGIRILTEERPPGTHLAHVQLRPIGRPPIPYYARTVVCEDGRGDTFIPLALDEAPGFYRVVVRDVLTGMVSEWPVEVAPPSVGQVSVTIAPQ